MPSPLMPAAVYVGAGKIEVDYVPVPEPRPGEVLVEIAECGICGSDLHLVLEDYAKPGSILGHEWSGVVVSGDTSGWAPGQRVVGNPTPGCGACRACRRGRPSVCLHRPPADLLGSHGAFCRYKSVSTGNVLRIPDSLSSRAAALTEPTAIALHAVHMGQVDPDDRVLVTGGGPVGLLIVAVLRSRGVTDITVSEPSPIRRERARAVGATQVVVPDTLVDPPVGVSVAQPYAVAFECSGRATAVEGALGQLDYAGTLVVVGTGFVPPRVNQNRMIIFELEIVGAYNYDAAGFAPAVELLDSGALPLEFLLEPEDIPLSGVMDAMERLSRGEIPGKVLVRPEAP
ncbi:MAG: zinc-dependent alcohol dehydrogenase [Acidimicrobiales bacterium]